MPKETKKFAIESLTTVKPLEFITSGSDEIDALTKFPRGRIVEIFGLQGIGKTTLATQLAAKMSQEGKVLFIDAENALNPERLRALGAVEQNISTSPEYLLEDVAEMVLDGVGKYDVIIVDSVASLVVKNEVEGEVGAHHVGLKARIMGQWMRKLVGPLGKSKTVCVFINQLRESMILYGDPTFRPGGKAIPYASSLSLKLTSNKVDRIIKDGKNTGHWVHVEVIKSKVCAPYQKTKFKVVY